MKNILIALFLSSTLFAANCPPESAIGNSMIGTNAGTLTPDRKRVSQFEMVETGYITNMHIYAQSGTDNQPIRGIIYSDLNGKPDQRLGITQEYVVQANAPKGWVVVSLATPIKVDAGFIWLGLHSGFSAAPGMVRFTVGKSRIISTDIYADGPSQNFGNPDTSLDGTMSVYAEYQLTPPSSCLTGSCMSVKWAAAPTSLPQTVVATINDPSTTFVGQWCPSSVVGSYPGTTSMYNCVGAPSPNTYTFTPAINIATNYEVFVWYTANQFRSTTVPVVVNGIPVNVNMTVGGASWFSLGTFPLSPGNTIVITDANGQASADAVQVVPVSNPNPPSNIAGYKLVWGKVSGTYTDSFETDANTFQAQINGLVPNTNYCFAVKSFDSNGVESQLSNEICATTLPGQNSLQF